MPLYDVVIITSRDGATRERDSYYVDASGPMEAADTALDTHCETYPERKTWPDLAARVSGFRSVFPYRPKEKR